MNKIIKAIVVSLVLCFLLSWLLPYLRYEYLTLQYGNSFAELQNSTHMIDEVDNLKVLTYSDSHARIYYIGNTGDILTFRKVNGSWELEDGSWVTVWSKTGSADGIIWPYFYHSSEGILIFTLLCFSLVIVLIVFVGAYLLISERMKKHEK